MCYKVVSRCSAFQFKSCLFGLVVVLTPKHLEKTVGCDANECGLGRIGMAGPHGWNAGILKCITGPLCVFDSR